MEARRCQPSATGCLNPLTWLRLVLLLGVALFGTAMAAINRRKMP
jgi:hypothetical protein